MKQDLGGLQSRSKQGVIIFLNKQHQILKNYQCDSYLDHRIVVARELSLEGDSVSGELREIVSRRVTT